MLCHTSLFVFSLCHHVTFYKTLTLLSTVFIKGHVGCLQLLKWPCHTSIFTHVEPLIYNTMYKLCCYVSCTKGLYICMSFPASSRVFHSCDSDPNLRDTLDAQCPVQARLELREGAQVRRVDLELWDTYLQFSRF